MINILTKIIAAVGCLVVIVLLGIGEIPIVKKFIERVNKRVESYDK